MQKLVDIIPTWSYNEKNAKKGGNSMAKIKVNITLDEELMRRVDEYAEENYLNRSSLVSLATTQFLNAADVTKAIKEMAFAMRKIADSGEIDEQTKRDLEDFERLSKMLVMQR